MEGHAEPYDARAVGVTVSCSGSGPLTPLETSRHRQPCASAARQEASGKWLGGALVSRRPSCQAL